MSDMEESSALKFSYLLVNVAWFAAIIILAALPVIFLMILFSDSAIIESINLNFPIATDVILFSPENTVSFMEIDSAVASARATYVADNYFGTFVAVFLIIQLSVGLSFYGITLLRGLLKDLKAAQVFTLVNIQRIKRIAISILALSPMQWLYRLSLLDPFESYLQETSVAIEVGSADIGLITTGLLIYTLALVFEKGYMQLNEKGRVG